MQQSQRTLFRPTSRAGTADTAANLNELGTLSGLSPTPRNTEPATRVSQNGFSTTVPRHYPGTLAISADVVVMQQQKNVAACFICKFAGHQGANCRLANVHPEEGWALRACSQSDAAWRVATFLVADREYTRHMAREFLAKNPGFKTAVDTASVALQRYLTEQQQQAEAALRAESERQAEATEERLQAESVPPTAVSEGSPDPPAHTSAPTPTRRLSFDDSPAPPRRMTPNTAFDIVTSTPTVPDRARMIEAAEVDLDRTTTVLNERRIDASKAKKALTSLEAVAASAPNEAFTSALAELRSQATRLADVCKHLDKIAKLKKQVVETYRKWHESLQSTGEQYQAKLRDLNDLMDGGASTQASRSQPRRSPTA